MRKNGFIASALLYGMLVLFLVIMLSTLYILANNKMSMDKLKENALDNVENNYYICENSSHDKLDDTLYTKEGCASTIGETPGLYCAKDCQAEAPA